MKKWLTILFGSVLTLVALTGCGMVQKEFKSDEFYTQSEVYKNSAQALLTKMVSVKYESDSENKIKDTDEYKKLMESLTYFESLNESTASSELQENTKVVKAKAKDVKTYHDTMIKEYIGAKGDQTEVTRVISEMVTKDENKTLMKDFLFAIYNINLKK